ncbi:SusC/RagA family TonB-linked outer membrane protein [Mediterranea massiliensis]
MPEFLTSQSQFAEWMNQACINGNVATKYRDDVIAKMKAYEADPKNNPEYEVIDGQLYYYGYSDFKEKMIKDVTPTQRHNINITGGSEKTRFYTSVGYLNQEGLYKVGDDNYKQLNTRINVENQTTKWMKLGFKALYNYSTQDKPFTYDGKDVWKRVIYTLPTDFIDAWQKDPRYPELDKFDGMYSENNAYALLKDGGRNKYDQHDVWLTATADFDILKGWKAHVDFNYNLNYKKASAHSKPIKFFDGSFNETYGRTSTNYYQMTNYNTSYYSFNAYTDYEHTFAEKHYLKAMVGFNQELTKYSTFSGKRYDILNDELPSLSLGSGNHEVSQNGYEWALRGGFFRLNYIYNDRYLFEFNGRYDGTSRFPSDNRFVFLPSFSAAWRISEESFMQGTRDWLDNLKLRASYGILGNQMISSSDWSGNTKYYPYIPFMSNSTSTYWLFGDTYATTINPGNLVSADLTWEKVSTMNFGIDMTFLQQRLDMSFDYYIRTTADMLIKTSYPALLGTTAPPENSAELKTRGWEFTISWRDKIGENFSYDLGFVLSDSQAEITKYNNPTGDISTYYEGKKVGDIWGYRVEGLFQSDEEAANWYSQKDIANVQWGAGDIKVKDLNGDGVIDDGIGTLDDHGDKEVIGNTTPRYQYGITANFTYKNYYLNLFMQGVGKRDFWPGDEAFWPAATQYYNAQTWHVYDSWTPENPGAYLPIARATDSRNRGVYTDRYLQNASYCRMKNITLGWNLPKQWISKINLSNASIYVSGENLFEFTKIKGPYDPEAAGGNGVMLYPFMRTYSLGINLTF